MTATASGRLASLLARNNAYIPGGISSTNRMIDPIVAFVRGQGAYLWDIDGKRYIDYHAAFAPLFSRPQLRAGQRGSRRVLRSRRKSYSARDRRTSKVGWRNSSATTSRLSKRCRLQNTGSEATSLAIRLSRAVTGRQHFIVVQGGYNGNHDELACNVFNTLAEIGPRVSPGEYPLRPLGAGTTIESTHFVHPVNFNDLESVRYVCRRYPIAAMITEPILQNIGVVQPAGRDICPALRAAGR